jgi:6-phosphogluconolactonase
MPKLHIYKNEKETCHAFAGWVADLVNETLSKQDRFAIAFSGVDAPKLVYKILATDFEAKIDWTKVHLFVADERLVSYPTERDRLTTICKNFEELPVPKEQIHLIKTDVGPEESTKQYEELLDSFFEGRKKSFDLVILSMGEQGNVLSMSPNEEDTSGRSEWVISVYDKQEDVFKITLTVAAINAASVKAFLVTGKKKEDVVQQVLKGKYNPEKYPAQLITTANTAVHWFLDEGAASKLIKPIS